MTIIETIIIEIEIIITRITEMKTNLPLLSKRLNFKMLVLYQTVETLMAISFATIVERQVIIVEIAFNRNHNFKAIETQVSELNERMHYI